MILLDSNAFLWLLNDKEKLGQKATAAIEAAYPEVYVSLVSIWELGLKHASHKTGQPISIEAMAEGVSLAGLDTLSLKTEHLLKYAHIRLPQKDPFDTLLVAQAEAEGMRFVTSDRAILSSSYRVVDASR